MPDASASPSRPRRGSADRHRRTPLSRRSIVTSPIALIEGDGSDALSTRRLGRRLGVEATALYHHFASRDELIAAIADELLAPLDELKPAADWTEACRRFATALRNVAVEHPATFRLVGLQPFDFSLGAAARRTATAGDRRRRLRARSSAGDLPGRGQLRPRLRAR